MTQIKASKEHAKLCADMHEQMFQYAKTYANRLDEAVQSLNKADSNAVQAIQNTGRAI